MCISNGWFKRTFVFFYAELDFVEIRPSSYGDAEICNQNRPQTSEYNRQNGQISKQLAFFCGECRNFLL